MDAAGNALGAGDDATKIRDGDEREGEIDADDDVDATDAPSAKAPRAKRVPR